jgi:hypothetical protein
MVRGAGTAAEFTLDRLRSYNGNHLGKKGY